MVALRDTEDYAVECADGELGRVEQVCADPPGLAVRLRDGRHALLRGDAVVAVDRQYRWVVVESDPELLELVPSAADRHWRPTGAVVHAEPPVPRPNLARLVPHPDVGARPLWQQVAILYAALTVIVVVAIGLVFVVSWAAGGAPY